MSEESHCPNVDRMSFKAKTKVSSSLSDNSNLFSLLYFGNRKSSTGDKSRASQAKRQILSSSVSNRNRHAFRFDDLFPPPVLVVIPVMHAILCIIGQETAPPERERALSSDLWDSGKLDHRSLL